MFMLERIGLVIHWFSLGLGILFTVMTLYGAYQNVRYIRTLDGGFDTAFLDQSLLLVIPMLILPLLLGWLIRYILSGKVHILPWK